MTNLPQSEIESGTPDFDTSAWQHARHVDYVDEHLVRLAARNLVVGGVKYQGLIIEEPPRHGKSEECSHYFPTWYLGTFPDHRIILASYEATFAETWGRKARNTMEEWGQAIFGVTVDQRSRAGNSWNLKGRKGGMNTAGIQGGITGRGANVLIVDDPIKNRAEAESETIRNNIWSEWTSTLRTRLEPDAIIVLIMTRWHEDDLAGRLIAQMDEEFSMNFLRIRMPAIAEDPEDFDAEEIAAGDYMPDPLGRDPGEALWPERYPLHSLYMIREDVKEYAWASMYQQRPTPLEGGMFKKEWLPIYPHPGGKFRKVVRRWDLAASDPKKADDPDYTVGLLMGLHTDGYYYVLDVERFQGDPAVVSRTLARVRDKDGRRVRIRMEQEPGSAGKLFIYQLGRTTFRGWPFRGMRTTGSKILRAETVAGAAERGEIRLVRGAWNRQFIRECTRFPNVRHDDQVDALSGAYEDHTKRAGGMTTW